MSTSNKHLFLQLRFFADASYFLLLLEAYIKLLVL